MKKAFFMLLVFVILVVVVLSFFQTQREKKAAEEMYENFCAALSAYPALSNRVEVSFCQFEKGGIKYLTIQSDGEYITGMRRANGETTYCHNSITYQVFDDKLVKTDFDMVDVNAIICSNLSSLISDDTVLFTYHRPSGRDLPLWIYPDDPAYLIIKRESYAEYMETMIYSDTEQYEIRWCITKSSSDEDVELFLLAVDYSIPTSALKHIHGWGDVPEAVLNLLDSVE